MEAAKLRFLEAKMARAAEAARERKEAKIIRTNSGDEKNVELGVLGSGGCACLARKKGCEGQNGEDRFPKQGRHWTCPKQGRHWKGFMGAIGGDATGHP